MRPIVYLSFAYAFSEFLLMLFRKSKDKNVKTREDRGSLILIWLVITIGFVAGFILSKPEKHFWTFFGSGFIVVGLIIRWAAILQLGGSFTVDVAINESANLKTDGIYESIRHPSYLGILLIVLGFAFTMNNLYSFLVLFVPVFISVMYRIHVEEKVLTNEFGYRYSEYTSKTKRIIPGIF